MISPEDAVKATLYEHQRDGAMRALEVFDKGYGGYGLLFEMGLGKSLTALAVMGTLYMEGKIARALVVAPASVCPVWPRELHSFAGFKYRAVSLAGLSGEKREAMLREKPIDGFLTVYVINYEMVWRIERELLKLGIDLIVCDESQRIKNHTAKQSKAMHRLGANAKYRMILTGTPIGNSPLDLFSQYRFLDPAVFPSRYTQFRARYAIMGGMRVNGRPVQVIAYQHLDELTDKAYKIASRATKADALDLPDKTFETRSVKLSPAGARHYRSMEKESITWLGEREATATNVLSRLLRLSQITGGFLPVDEGGDPISIDTAKIDALRDIVQDYAVSEGRKLVVFARFTKELDAIREMLDKELTGGLYFVSIRGDVPQGARGEIVRRFQEDGDCRVFVGQIKAASEGITLHAASCMVFYSMDYSYMTYAQAQDRIHRVGQKKPCTYILLAAEGTVDEDVILALGKKRDLSKDVIDGGWKRYFEKGKMQDGK